MANSRKDARKIRKGAMPEELAAYAVENGPPNAHVQRPQASGKENIAPTSLEQNILAKPQSITPRDVQSAAPTLADRIKSNRRTSSLTLEQRAAMAGMTNTFNIAQVGAVNINVTQPAAARASPRNHARAEGIKHSAPGNVVPETSSNTIVLEQSTPSVPPVGGAAVASTVPFTRSSKRKADDSSSRKPAKCVRVRGSQRATIYDMLLSSSDTIVNAVCSQMSATASPKAASPVPSPLTDATITRALLDETVVPQCSAPAPPTQSIQPPEELRPVHDVAGDTKFVEEVCARLQRQAKAKTPDFGRRQAQRILQLLQLAKPPSEGEALFAMTSEAAAQVAQNVFTTMPIFTEGQQSLPLQTPDQFLDEQYDDSVKVYVQDAGSRTEKTVKPVTIGTLKARLANPGKNKPWNCLELATHVEDGLRPSFLNTEDCRLLTKVKMRSSNANDDVDEASRRRYEAGYKEVEKWALLAQAGALTEPHQDSHGYSTYITVNTGPIGFGWLSNPSAPERAAWDAEPQNFISGAWRYVVLKPGQTVYFPAGTVHFVFRLPCVGHTLAFGGHVLRCSNIVHWIKTMLAERRNSDVTNEDISVSAPGYLNRVERFVRQAGRTGQVEKWGGREAVEEFLRLKGEFMAM